MSAPAATDDAKSTPPASAGAATTATTHDGPAGAYEDPELLHKLADTVRRTMKIRNGVLQETRVDYFKGTKLIKYLTTDSLSKADGKLPSVASEEQAIAIGNLLLRAKG
ncbi:hypothetical protein Naga_100645g3 [Nannochloropsis gaditana]|nr:hypothetical protein Naga_100645g3 [Nannochloropsis gaditana]